MPDTTSLPMAEGGRASGGKTNWPIIIGVGGGGVLLLVLLMSSQKSGSSGTTAAGTSINAALGTVQEQQLNLMGQLGQVQAGVTQQVADIQSSVNSSNAALGGELAGVNSNVIVGNQQSLIGLQDSFKRYAQTNFGYNANLGGGAGSLAMPQNWADFMNFLINPSLANPGYQAGLLKSRGYVFSPDNQFILGG